MKVTFETTENVERFVQMLKVDSVFCALDEIKNDIFRPARKHGYPEHMTALFEGRSEEDKEWLCDFIGVLEKKFYEILEDRGIELE